jgi:hypothetical protein
VTDWKFPAHVNVRPENGRAMDEYKRSFECALQRLQHASDGPLFGGTKWPPHDPGECWICDELIREAEATTMDGRWGDE